MKTSLKFTLDPKDAYDADQLTQLVQRKLKLPLGQIPEVQPKRRSIDARRSPVKVHLEVDIYLDETIPERKDYRNKLQFVGNARPVMIIGAGPAGLFAALKTIESGFKPIIVERGKDVQSRRRDLAAINKHHVVNPDSNYCFGEGGAGTYSDGKLYTRSKKRGDVDHILDILVSHGAPSDILIDAHPHIGTNKLPKVVKEIRNSILQAGGEILFNTALDKLIIDQDQLVGFEDRAGQRYRTEAMILATGHSARDIYKMLDVQGLALEIKPYALGLRVEHPQELIDKIQYHGCPRDVLPAASYSLAHSIGKKGTGGVFSFCMCPGGFIVPAATSPGEVVVNGMSPSRRDSRYANSGIVVSVTERDFAEFSKFGALAGMYFQQSIEQLACQVAGGLQTAPAQRLMDFLENKISTDLPDTSYQPGVSSQSLQEILPDQISHGIKQGFQAFGRKMKGFLTNEAILLGVESRTSSPVKIPRDKVSLQHPQVSGLIPCGEGAGYAGGIVSAAMDGIRCAHAAIAHINQKRAV